MFYVSDDLCGEGVDMGAGSLRSLFTTCEVISFESASRDLPRPLMKTSARGGFLTVAKETKMIFARLICGLISVCFSHLRPNSCLDLPPWPLS